MKYNREKRVNEFIIHKFFHQFWVRELCVWAARSQWLRYCAVFKDGTFFVCRRRRACRNKENRCQNLSTRKCTKDLIHYVGIFVRIIIFSIISFGVPDGELLADLRIFAQISPLRTVYVHFITTSLENPFGLREKKMAASYTNIKKIGTRAHDLVRSYILHRAKCVQYFLNFVNWFSTCPIVVHNTRIRVHTVCSPGPWPRIIAWTMEEKC